LIMQILRKLFSAFAIVLSVASVNVAHAGIPVIDAASLAQAVQQVTAWGQQFEQMKSQFTQMQQQYTSLNGARGMASLVNNPAARQYLPADYQTIVSNGYGNSQAIRNAAKIYGIENTALGGNAQKKADFETKANRAAVNQAVAEGGYREASRRFADIQVLLDKVNTAPDAKDIADLQARIQVEQVMMQNESIKLAMYAQLVQSQKDMDQQASTERMMKKGRGTMPGNW